MSSDSVSIIENRKVFKRNKVLNLIRTHEHCSRYDIKKLTSYSMATVLSMIDELIAAGYIIEEESSQKSVGRKPTWLSLNPLYGYFIGIEFHSCKINCAVLDFLGQMVCEIHESFSRTLHADAVLEKIAQVIQQAMERLPDGKPTLGLCMAIPGYFDAERGIGTEYRPIPSWKNIPVRDYFESRFHVPCMIENNVNAVAIGYQSYHLSGEDGDDFLFVSIRSGVRLVVMSNHDLLLCNKGYGGQLGHIQVHDGNSRMCLCGKRGCLNTEVADTGLRQKILEDISTGRMPYLMEMARHNAENISISMFVESVLAGYQESLELIGETADDLGKALGMMTDLFAPSRIVVYGELARAGDRLLQPLLCSLRHNAMRDNTQHLQVTLCEPDERLGAYGAARVMMHRQYEYIKETV